MGGRDTPHGADGADVKMWEGGQGEGASGVSDEQKQSNWVEKGGEEMRRAERRGEGRWGEEKGEGEKEKEEREGKGRGERRREKR